ncbi:MAG: DEAD/DEAH box helicase family protein [Thermofilaceae archaeon]
MRWILIKEESNMQEVVYHIQEEGLFKTKTLKAKEIDEKIPYERLNPVQTIFELYYKTGNALVATPTSSGKTLVGYLFFRRYLDKGKLIYLAPLKALVSEKASEFRNYFGNNVELRSGDNFFDSLKEPTKQVIVCTYDYFQTALRNKSAWTKEIAAIVMDEIHWSLTKPLYEELLTLLKPYPILALSATIPEKEKLAEYLEASLIISSEWRPVRLEKEVLKLTSFEEELKKEKSKKKKLETTEQIAIRLLEAIEKLSKPSEQVIVFVPSKKIGWKTLEIAHERKLNIMNQMVPFEKEEQIEIPEAMQIYEIAFHNADIPLDEKRNIEDAFKKERLKILISTKTLAYGVNLPADRVIVLVKGAKIKNKELITPTGLDIIQMEGRAGRYGIKEKGYVNLLLYGFSEEEFKRHYRITTEMEEIEKYLGLMLLLAIYHKGPNFKTFLKQTYKFSRYIQEDQIEAKLQELEKNQFLQNLKPTEYGMFCIKNGITPEAFSEFLKRIKLNLPINACVRPLIKKKFDSLDSYKEKYQEIDQDIKVIRHIHLQNLVFEDRTEEFLLFSYGLLAKYKDFKPPAEFHLGSDILYLLKHLLELKRFVPWTDEEILLNLHSIKYGIRPEWSLIGSIKGIGYIFGNILAEALRELKVQPPKIAQLSEEYFKSIKTEGIETKIKELLMERLEDSKKTKTALSKIKNAITSFTKNKGFFMDEQIARAYLFLKTGKRKFLTAKKSELAESLKEELTDPSSIIQF